MRGIRKIGYFTLILLSMIELVACKSTELLQVTELAYNDAKEVMIDEFLMDYTNIQFGEYLKSNVTEYEKETIDGRECSAYYVKGYVNATNMVKEQIEYGIFIYIVDKTQDLENNHEWYYVVDFIN